MEVEGTQDLIKSEEGKVISEIDILQYWTQNVANIDYAVIIENSALLVSCFKIAKSKVFHLLDFRVAAMITTKL